MKSSVPIPLLAALAVLAVGLAPVPAAAEPFETVMNNGDPQNRIDIVILGDGYTAAELQKYRTDLQLFLQFFFEQEPFREYQSYFNVHRIDVTSNQSGADHPERSSFVDTALDATYNCSGIQRLICVNNSKVTTIAANTLAPAQRDLIIVAVNDPEYGGSGGAVVVSSTNESAIDIVLHEEGHSLGLLADEYGGPPPPVCDNSVEPPEVNATRQTQRALIKWVAWIDAGTPVPTTSSAPGVPGLYEGARYCDSGLFRPTFKSKMRDVDFPFEQVGTEQLIKRYYNLVSPIDSSLPVASILNLDPANSLTFGVSVLAPLTHSLNVSWSVDGQPRATGSAFVLAGSSVATGPHSIAVEVRDPATQVRNDPAQLLRAGRTWNVTVVADADGDGIADAADNCTLVANQSQLDANGDGYGNICDADLNNSGLVTTADFAILRSVLNQSASANPTAAAADLNGSGTVTTADFAILRSRLNTAPGPSGLQP